MRDREFMRQALDLAKTAMDMGEVPVGAVVVENGVVIGRGHNLREASHLPTAHAEVLAIEEAARHKGDWRLDGCTLYVSLEPCPMCTGAIFNSRIGRVVYGAFDEKAGCFGSVCNMRKMAFPYVPEVEAGVLDQESRALLQTFFQQLRKDK